jgi:exo-1,4-beta-D-glucosaminidase
MSHLRNLGGLVLVLCSPAGAAAAPTSEVADLSRLLLRENWSIQSSANVPADGAAISTVGFPSRDWYPATLPSTVLSALVRDEVYPDPYAGTNLRSIPGTTYPLFSDFSNIMMPPGSPFRHAWWYRTELRLPAGFQGKTIWLSFDGINYRANVWMNGVEIVGRDQMAGTWRLFELDVTSAAKAGEMNALAVEVFPPRPRDLALTLVDWAPMPPDKEMGIWRDVHLRATARIKLRHPAVLTTLDLPSTDRARLTVRAVLTNAADQPVDGVVKGRIEDLAFEQPVHLAARETRTIRYTPDDFPQLNVAHPRLWWPAQVGEQSLYPLDLTVEAGGQVSDSAHIRFGIRQVTSRIDEHGHRLFQINGKNILIRGAGYSFDMMLRSSPERQQDALNYVRDLNLNAVRMEGKLEDDHFFDLADEMGILMLPGWCCCDMWENWSEWDQETERIARESLRDQVQRLERHPSVLAWLYGSDFAPPPKIERMYLQIFREEDWPNPTISSAAGRTTTVGPSGVKMTGPYEYVAPSFWYLDKRHGGAFGFNTETSPGPAVPPIESLRRMLPPDHLWPIDSVWEFHAGGMSRTLSVFTEALDRRYGPAHSAEEYATKAQSLAYEAHRAMMEAYGRNKYTSTGIIQWMLDNAWPSMIWHMYDWYLRPGGSYFGVKKACEPLHVQYSYDDRSVVVVNSYYQSFPNLRVRARIYDFDMSEQLSKEAEITAGPDSSTRVFILPSPAKLSTTYFVSLTLESAGRIESRNFYWLSTRPETLDWSRQEEDPTGEYDISTWTPTRTYADYTELNALPRVDLDATAEYRRDGEESSTMVTVHNPSRTLAFAVHLKVNRALGRRVDRELPRDPEILPVLWEDNYFALLPDETRHVTARFRTGDAGKGIPSVEIEGWNVSPKTVEPRRRASTPSSSRIPGPGTGAPFVASPPAASGLETVPDPVADDDLPVAAHLDRDLPQPPFGPRRVRREAEDVLRPKVGHDLVEDPGQGLLLRKSEQPAAGDPGQPAQVPERGPGILPVSGGRRRVGHGVDRDRLGLDGLLERRRVGGAHGVDAVREQDDGRAAVRRAERAQTEDDGVAQRRVASLRGRPHALEERLGVRAVEVLHVLGLVEEDDDDLLRVGETGQEAHGGVLRAAQGVEHAVARVDQQRHVERRRPAAPPLPHPGAEIDPPLSPVLAEDEVAGGEAVDRPSPRILDHHRDVDERRAGGEDGDRLRPDEGSRGEPGREARGREQRGAAHAYWTAAAAAAFGALR